MYWREFMDVSLSSLENAHFGRIALYNSKQTKIEQHSKIQFDGDLRQTILE